MKYMVLQSFGGQISGQQGQCVSIDSKKDAEALKRAGYIEEYNEMSNKEVEELTQENKRLQEEVEELTQENKKIKEELEKNKK